jgi:hypothetical protein
MRQFRIPSSAYAFSEKQFAGERQSIEFFRVSLRDILDSLRKFDYSRSDIARSSSAMSYATKTRMHRDKVMPCLPARSQQLGCKERTNPGSML